MQKETIYEGRNFRLKLNLDKFKRNYRPFKETFSVELSEFWTSNLLGFDIAKFNEYIETPNGVSMSEHIEQVYGKVAHAIVSDLVGV